VDYWTEQPIVWSLVIV